MESILKDLAKICTVDELRLEREKLLSRKHELKQILNDDYNYRTKFGEWKDPKVNRANIIEAGNIKRKLNFVNDKMAILLHKDKETKQRERDAKEKDVLHIFKNCVREISIDVYKQAWEMTNWRLNNNENSRNQI